MIGLESLINYLSASGKLMLGTSGSLTSGAEPQEASAPKAAAERIKAKSFILIT